MTKTNITFLIGNVVSNIFFIRQFVRRKQYSSRIWQKKFPGTRPFFRRRDHLTPEMNINFLIKMFDSVPFFRRRVTLTFRIVFCHNIFEFESLKSCSIRTFRLCERREPRRKCLKLITSHFFFFHPVIVRSSFGSTLTEILFARTYVYTVIMVLKLVSNPASLRPDFTN